VVTGIHPVTGIKRRHSNKIKHISPEIGHYICKERWERVVKKLMKEMKRGREMTKQKIK
jgi:hypothetical protein